MEGFPCQAEEFQINLRQWEDIWSFKAECNQRCFTMINPVDLCKSSGRGKGTGRVSNQEADVVRCEVIRFLNKHGIG